MSDLVNPIESASHAPPGSLLIFLSRSMADRDHVAVVQRHIEALGVDVYLAEHDPLPGTSIAQRVDHAVRDSAAVVVLVTTNSVNSAYVQQEVGLARAHRKPIVPIVDRQVDKSRLGILTEVDWLEIDLDKPAEALARVTQSLQPLVRAQLTVPTQIALAGAGVGNDPTINTFDVDSMMLMGIGLLGLLITSLAFSGGEADGL